MEKKFRAFAFTVRQKSGNTAETNKVFVEFIKKKNGGFAVLEKEGTELHMHAGVFLENPTSKSNLNLQLQRIYEKVRRDEDSIKVLRGGTRIMYNLDFWESYCQKENNPRVLFECIPSEVDEYFPSEDEQNAARTRDVDSVMSELELLVKEEEPWANSPDYIDKAMYSIWFIKKLRKAPREKRKKREICEDLKKWMFPESMEIDW